MKIVMLLTITVLVGILLFKLNHTASLHYNTIPHFAKQLVETASSVVQPSNEKVVLAFVGDIMTDRHIRKMAELHGYDSILASSTPLLMQADVVIGNLEGPITTTASLSLGTEPFTPNNYFFTFSPTTTTLLRDNNIMLVSLDNNHIYNFGQKNLYTTKKYLSEANIQSIGDPTDHNGVVKRFGKIIVGFATYNQFLGPPASVTEFLVRDLSSTTDFVVVYTHWGEEYEQTATTSQRQLAQKFIDAGADLIVGSHPHVVQNKEIYNGKPIYYSLGNFVFDQYFSRATRCGAVLFVTIEKNKIISTEEHFVEMLSNGKTIPSDCMKQVPLLPTTTATST